VHAVAAVVGLWALSAAGGSAAAQGEKAVTGLPVPRFVTLRGSEVNLRTGPGVRYPVDWVFHRRDLPVEITAEFESWRKIRDVDGTEGWVHQSMLSGRRSVLIVGNERSLREAPDEAAAVIARAEPGVVARLETCEALWCRVSVEGHDGWLRREEFWGVYPEEKIE
jgi:SH3-like domain-containing protein